MSTLPIGSALWGVFADFKRPIQKSLGSREALRTLVVESGRIRGPREDLRLLRHILVCLRALIADELLWWRFEVPLNPYERVEIEVSRPRARLNSEYLPDQTRIEFDDDTFLLGSIGGNFERTFSILDDVRYSSSELGYLHKSETQHHFELCNRALFVPADIENFGGHILEFLRSLDTKPWAFWREWYQGFLDGKPLDWELQKEIALIPDADWDKGPERIAELIEEIRARFELRKRIAELELEIDTSGKVRLGIGGNNPPEPIEAESAMPKELIFV